MTTFGYISPHSYPLWGALWSESGDTLTGYVVPGCVGDGAWMAWENSSAVAVVVVAHLAQLFTDLPTFSKIRFFHEWGPYKRWGLVQHVILKIIAFRVFLVSSKIDTFAKHVHKKKNSEND